MSKYNILLVDDEDENLSSTKDLLRRWGYTVDAVNSGAEAVDYVKTSAKDYAVALLDYKMPGKNGAETAKEIRALNDEIMLLMYSAYPSVESLTATIRVGSLNFIDKNDDLNYLKSSLERACIEYEKVRKVRPPLTPSESTQKVRRLGMVGRSEKLAFVSDQVDLFKKSKKPTLILGETGVGKEMVARALHAGGDDSYFAVNCAALQGSNLVESELFGHEKGSFTGAAVRKVGILEAARGGTVYLDEIHHLDLQTQARLLRALREKKVRRVGGIKEEDVNFKLVASSWPNIEERVANGSFLPDLYYRLRFLSIEIPPLRDRPEDIEPLITHFCEKHLKETGEKKTFLARTIRPLEKYNWPGNVGELDGYVSSLLASANGPTVDESQLDMKYLCNDGTSAPSEIIFAKHQARQQRETGQLLISVINSSKSIRHAATRTGLKPSSLHTLIDRLGIRSALKTD